MKFNRTPPTEEGFYWCFLTSKHGTGTVQIGEVQKTGKGFYRVVAGVFACDSFDWDDSLYWGDKIKTPTLDDVELEK